MAAKSTLSPEEIRRRLRALEARERVRVLYACESGSRCWGFASADSDYDVRFVFVRPLKDYLRLEPPRDTIEEPVDALWDVSGWDLRKALQLLRKTNAALLEWLHSPVCYLGEPGFLGEMRLLASGAMRPASLFRSYQGMARGNIREYLSGERVRLKKYLYMLRPLMACDFLARTGGARMPPVVFAELAASLPLEGDARAELDCLLKAKEQGLEKETGPHCKALDAYIRRMAEAPCPFAEGGSPAPAEAMDDFFFRMASATSADGESGRAAF